MKLANILDEIHNELSPLVWDLPASAKPKLKPKHAHWIKSQIYTTLELAGYTDVEKWLTLVLTGSICTYQYSNESDIDISLFVDSVIFPEWSRAEMIALMVEKLDGKTLPGTPFPLQNFVVGEGIKPHDLYKPGLRSGYDIDTNIWLVPPERDRVHDVKSHEGGFYAWSLQVADKMERLLRYEPAAAVEYWHQIHSRRQRDMKAGKGDFAESNVVYKMLAQRGLFPKIAERSGEYIAKTADPLTELLQESYAGYGCGQIWVNKEKKKIYINVGDGEGDVNDEVTKLAEEEWPGYHIEVEAEMGYPGNGWELSPRSAAPPTKQEKTTKKEKPPHLKESAGQKACWNCWAYDNGHCEMFDYKVREDQVCDDWEKTKPRKKAASLTEFDFSPIIGDHGIQNIPSDPHQSKLAQAPEGHEEAEIAFPSLEDAIAANQAALAAAGQGNHALLRPEVLEGALGRAQNQYYYTGSLANAAAALAHGVGQAQAFEDGNKRTAYWLTHQFLHENGLGHLAPDDDEELADHLVGYGEGTHQMEDTADMFRARSGGRLSKIAAKLWVDDTRRPPSMEFDWARNAEQAKKMLSENDYTHASLDHDLGVIRTLRGEGYDANAPDGTDLANWMVQEGRVPPRIHIHSQNPAGAQQMASVLDGQTELTVEPTARDDQNEWSTKTAAKVIYDEFKPDPVHPKESNAEPTLPFIYDPATEIVHLGPAGAWHWQLINRIPELRQQYEGDWNQPAVSAAPEGHIHGHMEWPSRRTHFQSLTTPEEESTIRQALGAPEPEPDAPHWDFQSKEAKVDVDQVAQRVYKAVTEGEGIAINLHGEPPTKRYGFAPAKDTETPYGVASFTPQDVLNFINRFQDRLADPEKFVGAWMQGDQVILDVSEGHDDFREAYNRAWAGEQQSLWDNVANEEIPVRGLDFVPGA